MNDTQPKVQLLGHVTVSGEIEAVTGLHIGGTADAIDKGGIDHPVIKNPVTNEPYIPGSSLRGRMRSLLERKRAQQLSEMAEGIWMEIYTDETEENKEKAKKSEVCRVFGNAQTGLPSILLVRDALYTEDTKLKYIESGLPVTEAKIEIAVDRITAQALPRTIERVPAGARFAFSMVYRVQQDNNRPQAIKNVEEDLVNILGALEEIEKFDGLGGNTARGHGQVKFHLKPLHVVRYGGENEPSKIPHDEAAEMGFHAVSDLKAKVSDISFYSA
ncbi:type III-A CRISPR-associated RAMP protein Csm3 [Prosthecochloris sp. N3]|uniref:CRISPR system Cms endoribonuclease Csm3 n=1 Tax=Prosthecochloris ethylica TaxID=2743976 RepID=A0ABR9XQM0_9CHLB|nr:type III-A CRISPR-associated RAMP protein Csm3 [Prosthecochloris ethylica]MBF0585467.1 type III-A CRISPR-associated RAMP protein Csm3 [Prosthecochloris ethylica]MBF0636253.1 type III-A CRISPR-associated RAMP protein Csm3 [Prosthecochloris ethylica]NUK46697.1 type III-A CRISPR-associated RAMP protein Csm3 [Prosthecochloris ethylica]